MSHLQTILQTLKQHTLFLNKKKCNFNLPNIEYLGHIISAQGLATDLTKIEALWSWLVLKDVKGLRGFLGITRYYRHFAKDYGKISKPLTQLLKKDNFCWSNKA